MSTNSDNPRDEFIPSSSPNSSFGSSPPPQRPGSGFPGNAGGGGLLTMQVVQPRSALTSIFVIIASTLGLCMIFCFFGMIFAGTLFALIAELAGTADKTQLVEKFVQGDELADKKIAIISISGVIVGGDDSFVKKQIDQVTSDADVVAVVLRVDSPGGTISGSDYFLYLLKNLKSERKIPIIVSMGSVAASGGYYVSMVGDEIYAENTTITGSIGVIMPHYNAADLCDKIGIASDPITSGPMKTMGSFTKPMTPDERKLWQALVDESFGQFKQVIREGRGNFEKEPEKLDALATGQIYTSKQALENGLIDKIGFQEDAIKRAMELAGCSQNNAKVIKYKPQPTFMDALGGEVRSSSVQPGAVAELLSPKLYYICPRYLPVLDGKQ